MNNKVEFDVSAEDIANGVQCSSWACPIAIAAERYFSFQTGWDVQTSMGVSLLTVVIPEMVDRFTYEANKQTQRKVRDFDKGTNIRPFKAHFEIWVP